MTEPEGWEALLGVRDQAVAVLPAELAGDRIQSPDELLGPLARLRAGTTRFALPQYGVALNRLMIGEIQPTGGLLEAAEKRAVEERERAAEMVELERVTERATELSQRFEIPVDEAIELVQTERSEVEKSVREHRVSLSGSTRALIEAIIGRSVE